jgi:23S rRNA pseudouridine2605 synthase
MLERLQKIISRAGITSRRQAEQLIRSGQVTVNGVVVTELGSKADPERDRVEAAGRVARPATTHAYILLHKPSQVVSTLADPEGRRTLRNLLPGVPERVYPVGRLDYAASGLVLLTNDGELAARVLKAASRLPQTYWIKVKGRLSEEQMRAIGAAAHVRIDPLESSRGSKENPWYEVQLSSARRDTLGKTLLDLGHRMEKMKRVRLGPLDLERVPEGTYRRLEPAEVASFSRAVERSLTETAIKSSTNTKRSHAAGHEPRFKTTIKPSFKPSFGHSGKPSLKPSSTPSYKPRIKPTGKSPRKSRYFARPKAK